MAIVAYVYSLCLLFQNISNVFGSKSKSRPKLSKSNAMNCFKSVYERKNAIFLVFFLSYLKTDKGSLHECLKRNHQCGHTPFPGF